jgi:hypothetical protein
MPVELADDSYAIYSQFMRARFEARRTENRLCLIAETSFAPPAPPVEDVIPADWNQRRHAIIVPTGDKWTDLQQVLEGYRAHAKELIQLERRFDLPADSGPQESLPYRLLDDRMQQQFLASFRPQIFLQNLDGTFTSNETRDWALLEKLKGCSDLFRLSRVFFNRARNLALVYCNDGMADGLFEAWGVFAKLGEVWRIQGEEQGWLIMQPSATQF